MTRKLPPNLSRRKFFRICTRIALGLAGVLGLGGLIRYFSHKPAADRPRVYDLGPVEDFPASGNLIRPDIPAVIYQTDLGFEAYSLICTHLGCTLEESGEGFSCPCHGSQFNPVGKVIKGPAREDLETLDIEVTESGDLIIYTDGGLL